MTASEEHLWIADLFRLCQLLSKVHKELLLNCSIAVKSSENRKEQKEDWDYIVF